MQSLPNNFQLSIFKEISKDCIGSNMMISPINIYHILSLTANGAEGSTKAQMIQALGHSNLNELNQSNKLLSLIIKKLKTVEMANAVFTRFVPEKSFNQSIQDYKADIKKMESVEQINKFVSDATHKKIDKIINELNPNDLMILINAIYFKGAWKKKFNKNKTEKNIFMNFNKTPKETDFMNLVQNFEYFSNAEVQAISMDYNSDHLKALIILPRGGIDINDYIQNLNFNKYSSIIKGLKNTKVIFSMPKFEIRYSCSVKGYLKSLGMIDAFEENTADFSLMKKSLPLFIQDVIHKTFIKVDEEGTEAAAVTAVVMRTKGLHQKPPEDIVMNVDHPFLFIIRTDNIPQGYDILFLSKIESL